MKLPSLPPLTPEQMASVKDPVDAFSLASTLVAEAFGSYPAGPNGEFFSVVVEGVPLKIVRTVGKRHDIVVGNEPLVTGKLPSDAISILRDRLIKHWQNLIMKSVGVVKKGPSQDEKEMLRQLNPKNYLPGTRLLK